MEKKIILSSEILRQIGALDVTPGLRCAERDKPGSCDYAGIMRVLSDRFYHCEGDAAAVATLLTILYYGSLTIVTSNDEPESFASPKWMYPRPMESSVYRALDGQTRLIIRFNYGADSGVTNFVVEVVTRDNVADSDVINGVSYERNDSTITIALQGTVAAGDKVFKSLIADLNLTEADSMFICTLLSISGRCLAFYQKPTNVCICVDHRDISQVAPDQPANIVALKARDAEYNHLFNHLFTAIGKWKGVSTDDASRTQLNGETVVTVIRGGKPEKRTSFCFDRLAAQIELEDKQSLEYPNGAGNESDDPATAEVRRRISQALPGVSPAKVATLTAGVLAIATAFDKSCDDPAPASSTRVSTERADDVKDEAEAAQASYATHDDPEQWLFETTASRRARAKAQNSSSLEQLLDNEVFFS